ncbi:hypothetical protein KEM60_01807 [Austwickia sp. TVS 96-490-7B]|uniref:SIMPL domain-containing protein n=1 Tax=Austwickia sp. TVS 96-490-7B TaxID=2830843 RepID=UPI001C59FF03|nr:SIMPL domain-containing protein [Austwickia sp. TVS 96-490-7B]MBW3085605.1 hypothetical protein [Austwickia sp. TVS 96-490-7B]
MEITVVGYKRASVPAERATVHLMAGFESGDKSEAMTRATSLVGKLTAHIQVLEGAGSSPITWYAVLPMETRSWRPHSDSGAILPLRHQVSAEVKVKFRDFAALAHFVQQVGGTAGVTLHHVEWTLTEVTQERLRQQLLAQAVAEATSRAVTLATAAGAAEVVPLEIADPGLLSGVGGAMTTLSVGGTSWRGAHLSDSSPSGEGVRVLPEDIVLEAEVHARFGAT